MKAVRAEATSSHGVPSPSQSAMEFSDAPTFYVYVLASGRDGEMAVSMTQDIVTRVRNQKNDLHPRDYTSVHKTHTLVLVEEFEDICASMERYEHLRQMDKSHLAQMVGDENPDWRDLYNFYVS